MLKIKCLFFTLVLIYVIPLQAYDVKKFDLTGIKLGMKESDVLKNLYCKNPEKGSGYHGKNGTRYICEPKNIDYSKAYKTLKVYLDNLNQVFRIEYTVKFEVKPNLDILEKRLITKYGNTNLKDSSTDYAETALKRRSLCWGRCTVHTSGRGGELYEAYDTTGLSATFYFWDNRSDYKMNIYLTDGIAHKKYEEYESMSYKRKQQSLKNNATNVDF